MKACNIFYWRVKTKEVGVRKKGGAIQGKRKWKRKEDITGSVVLDTKHQ